MSLQRLNASDITALLNEWLETEFTFIRAEPIAEQLAALGGNTQPLILDLVKRVASTNVEVAHQLARHSDKALSLLEPHLIREWAMFATDCYDSAGLAPALAVIRDLEGFVARHNERQYGVLLEESANVLTSFLRGLSGRHLEIEEDDVAWTDGEILYLPRVLAEFENKDENFALYKAMVSHLWAQTRFGTFRIPLVEALSRFPDRGRALALFNCFETLRLDACLARELPGLFRRMVLLRGLTCEAAIRHGWEHTAAGLRQRSATVRDSLDAVSLHYRDPCPAAVCYQGMLRPVEVEQKRAARIEREKVLIRVRLREVLDELDREGREGHEDDRFEQRKKADPSTPEGFVNELWLDGKPIQPPADVAAMVTSVMLDLGELPEEYLYPAGDGEYDISQYLSQRPDVDDVWSGTYHEDGAFLYSEWDFNRRSHKKNWCVVRQHSVDSGDIGFYHETLGRHRFVVGHLRRTFEILRGEDRLLKRQSHGEDVDIDALVDGYADMKSGLEMSDRLFTRLHREERNIAVMLMVDLSGSTKGWINDAEREALILLSEALEILGDRYAIYGFSGWGRKRCEVFKVKGFDEPLSEEVKGRICAIEAKDYTRMGPAIRHLSRLLGEVDAKVRLLITLSDGKPDDYDPQYRGQYGIEDTRMALFEARRDGVHPYCITIDKEGQDYLPHMYGAANYAVIDDVARLPVKVSDIYRKITS